MLAVSTLRERRRSGRLQGSSRGQDARERILALRATVTRVRAHAQRPRSGRLQGSSRGQDARERILALRTTGLTE